VHRRKSGEGKTGERGERLEVRGLFHKLRG
jgi:hypothetical protein